MKRADTLRKTAGRPHTGGPKQPLAGGAPADQARRSTRTPARRRWAWLAASATFLLVATALSFLVGTRPLSPEVVWHALVSPTGTEPDLIVRTLRAPRTLVGICVGVALATAGVLMQGVTRNPIADPGILGVNAGAATGVVAASYLLDVGGLSGQVWFGFAGAALATALVYGVASAARTGATPTTLVLAGAALTALLAGIIAAIVVFDHRTMDAYRFWVVGSLAGVQTDAAWRILPFLSAGLLLAVASARGLDALALGDEMAAGLGHKAARTRFLAAAAVTVLTGAAVAATGPIAFVGLMAPHLARALVGSGHRWLLAAAALLGPAVLLASDVVGRVITAPAEVHAGVITAILGAPVLIALVRRRVVMAP
ncbi:MAG: FecCD family ABC transporter permease [Micromonosporaceae bacterium]